MNWIKTNRITKILFSNYIWEIPNKSKKVYLTFDDGPIPVVTEWVLDTLKNKKENIKATFFCIGDNIKKHPEIFKRIINEGHSIGNHTFNHLKGWETNTNVYLENFNLCEDEIQKNSGKNTNLFRPPYGKIKLSQSRLLRKKGYKIIMWDIITFDFDTKTTPEKCFSNVNDNVASGSIIVFHDSIKAEQNLRYALPKAIKQLKEKGFEFDVIS
ncbi:MAG: polysaccharide deacetylase family protein [Flavobacteriaceae bacterium]|nr:polysaccharide deacetylase family protein [Flavobacteriaceae bacterium]